MFGLITTAISAFQQSPLGQAKTGLSQNFGEAVTNKTNLSVITIIGFSINHIQDNPESNAGWIMLAMCLLAVTLRDTAHKILKALKDKE